VRKLSRSSKGTREQPGKQVRQKSGLNRAILDQGWGELRRQRAYKLEWNGGLLLAVQLGRSVKQEPAEGVMQRIA
jgi:putative transposase